MARIGLKYFRYGILDEATETYGGALQLGKAVDCKVSLDLNSAELYADDGLAESDYTVKKGTVAITVDEDDDQTISALTGHEISLAVIGGVFVIETLTVIIQLTSVILFKKKIFLMTPIHHHFERLGWRESDIVKLFWIIGFILCLLALIYGVWL